MQVLIVDDSPTQRALWMYALGSTGVQVFGSDDFAPSTDVDDLAGIRLVTAKHGEQAEQILRRSTVDLLVTDIEMPGMDGWELARIAQAAQRSLPVLVVSSKVRTGQAPEIGLDPRRTFVVAKTDRKEAVTLARRLLGMASAA